MSRNRPRSLVVILLTLFASYISATGTYARQDNPNGGWVQLGNAAADPSAIAVDSTGTPGIYVLGAQGISRSTDRGETWKVCAPEARFMRVAPPSTVLSAGYAGPKLSGDGCSTWSDLSGKGLLPAPGSVRWLAAHPTNKGVLFAGMDGLGGLYRTANGGATWQPASKGLPSGTWVTALTADPRRPEVLFVGLRYIGQVRSPAYVFQSVDGGLSWRSASLGLRIMPDRASAITGLAWSSEKLFAATSADGLYSYSEQSHSWNPVSLPDAHSAGATPALPGPPIARATTQIKALFGARGGALVIHTSEGVYQTLDAATTWQRFGPVAAGNPSLLYVDAGGRAILAGREQIWGYNLSATAVAQQNSGTVSSPGEEQHASEQALAPSMPTPQPDEPTPPPTPAPRAYTPPAAHPTQAPSLQPASPTPTLPPRPNGPLPSDPAHPANPAVSSYFAETAHNVGYGFRDYWFSIDGMRLLGYPLTEEFVENGVTVQYFERARLEYQKGKIRWGRLGAELIEGKFFQTVRFFVSDEDHAYFGPTQHSASGPFLHFWSDNGGLEIFGFPLSESFKEGKSEYQWFERARLEWHPNLPEGKRIVLGQLGREALQKRGWIK